VSTFILYTCSSSSNPRNKTLAGLDLFILAALPLYLGNHSQADTCSYELIFHNGRYYQFRKDWVFLLNHPVYVDCNRLEIQDLKFWRSHTQQLIVTNVSAKLLPSCSG
jgi:hypothetical protein